MKKRFLAAVMATAMAATLLAGCGGSSDSASSAASSAASEAAEAVSEAAEAASSAASEAAEAVSEAADDAAETVSEAADAGADAAEGWVMDMDNMLAGSPFEGLTANDEYTYQLIVKASQQASSQQLLKVQMQLQQILALSLTAWARTQSPISQTRLTCSTQQS